MSSRKQPRKDGEKGRAVTPSSLLLILASVSFEMWKQVGARYAFAP
jgi:hypothetical protein